MLQKIGPEIFSLPISSTSLFQDSQCSDEDTESPPNSRGILEFSADKAGQDVTPLNFNFSKQRSTTLNSITGKICPLPENE